MFRCFIAFSLLMLLLGCGSESAEVATKNVNTPKVATKNVVGDSENKKPVTTIKFDKIIHDFGKIEADKDYVAKFKITNTGNNPLYINDVNPICGCTVSDWNKEAIAPGKSDEIQLTYHPGPKLTGPQHKTATVFMNTEEEFVVLELKAEVKKH